MATMLGSLLVSLGLQSTQFKRGIREAKQDVDRFSKFAAIGLSAVAAGATAAAGAFALMVKQSINTADEISKAAQSIGIGTEELSRLRYAADLSGVSFEQLQTGVGRLSRNMLDASRGLAAPARAFAQLGIEVKNSDGTLRTATEVMGDVADRFAGMEDGAEKTALAMEIFGRAGANLIPMLNGGRDGIKQLTEEADRFGIVIDTETGRKAEAFNDNLTRLGGQFQALAISIAADMLPMMVSFSEWLIKNQGEIIATVGRIGDFINGIARMASAVARGVAWMEERFGSLARAIGIAIGPLNTLVNLTMRLGGGGGGSGGPIGQTAMGMQSLASQAIAMGKAMGGVETTTTSAAKAIGKAGAAASVAKDDFADMMEALYPENITRRQREMAANVTRFADQISDPFDARLRALGAGGPATLSKGLLTEGSLVDEGAIKGAAEKIKQEMAGLADKTQTQTVRVAESFAQMSQRITSSIQGLANSIRSGDILGILGGVLNIFTSLGSAGVFGSKIQTNLNKAIPGFAMGTNSAPGGLSIVGERGPELVNLPRGSGVMTNRELRNLGGTSVQVIPSPYFDVVVDGRIVQSAPAVANAGAMQAQAMAGRSARRRVR